MKIIEKTEVTGKGSLTSTKIGEYMGRVPDKIGTLGAIMSIEKDLIDSYHVLLAKIREEQVELGRS